MKGFEKFILVIFSILIIIVSVFLILMSTQMIQGADILNVGIEWLISHKMVGLITGAVLSLLALIGIFASSDNADEMKSGLAIKSETGTVYITRDTFESIIVGVTRNYAELRNVKVDISMSEDGVIANIYAMILPDTVVPALTSKLQSNVKASVLKQTTVEIKEANIKIKGVYLEPQKK
ncbi:MAG: alkaline shock response membrane anchor protein AmaP [Clostridia bacterium]|nr:alkaline shock response membrane anchor protein AmaP [Clostridia bacterium]